MIAAGLFLKQDNKKQGPQDDWSPFFEFIVINSCFLRRKYDGNDAKDQDNRQGAKRDPQYGDCDHTDDCKADQTEDASDDLASEMCCR